MFILHMATIQVSFHLRRLRRYGGEWWGHAFWRQHNGMKYRRCRHPAWGAGIPIYRGTQTPSGGGCAPDCVRDYGDRHMMRIVRGRSCAIHRAWGRHPRRSRVPHPSAINVAATPLNLMLIGAIPLNIYNTLPYGFVSRYIDSKAVSSVQWQE